MVSLILRTATRFLMALLLLFSVFLLLRGHNEPGGGFIGGLVAATAFVLYAIAFDVESARRALRVEPRNLIGVGLLLAAGSGVVPLMLGRPFMSGMWWMWKGVPAAGTPVLFDVGVFLVVVGVTLTIVLSLAEE
jgi:multicomponent Na+:H+ antiporter subunit B